MSITGVTFGAFVLATFDAFALALAVSLTADFARAFRLGFLAVFFMRFPLGVK